MTFFMVRDRDNWKQAFSAWLQTPMNIEDATYPRSPGCVSRGQPMRMTQAHSLLIKLTCESYWQSVVHNMSGNMHVTSQVYFLSETISAIVSASPPSTTSS